MQSKNIWRRRLGALIFAAGFSAPALGYGIDGHLIAGRAAEAHLCVAAKAEVAALGGGSALAELGLWADRIRSIERYQKTRPWHYMNTDAPGGSTEHSGGFELEAANARIADFVHPSEGDVLWAIEHFYGVLTDQSESESTRAEALKFLTHFIVDIHQPLHVGLLADRGGNRIEFWFQRRRTNLHQFWDTEAVRQAGLSVARYARELTAEINAADLESLSRSMPAPDRWAAESLALRARVYEFDLAIGLTDAYLDFAARATRERLRLAATRLAATLNAAFCR